MSPKVDGGYRVESIEVAIGTGGILNAPAIMLFVGLRGEWYALSDDHAEALELSLQAARAEMRARREGL